MDFDEQVDLEHLLFLDRRCKTCGEVKNLLEDYYQADYYYWTEGECEDDSDFLIVDDQKK